jgi:hypothetical protein
MVTMAYTSYLQSAAQFLYDWYYKYSKQTIFFLSLSSTLTELPRAANTSNRTRQTSTLGEDTQSYMEIRQK